MVQRALHVAALALLLALPAAAATPQVAIEGDLQWSAPSRLDGLLWTAPEADSYAFLQPHPPGSGTPQILNSPHAKLVLHRRVTADLDHTAGLPPISHDSRSEQLPDEATDLRIDWRGPVGIAQMFVDGAGTASLRVDATSCELRPSAPRDEVNFPDPGPDRPGLPWQTRASDPAQLVAACRTGTLSDASIGRVWIYGMELRVIGRDLDQIVWTGTRALTESPQSALAAATRSQAREYNSVTQVLEVISADAPLGLEVAAPGTVVIHASHFFANGRLAMPTSEGRLAWGGRQREGAIEPVGADGIFRFSREGSNNVGLQGHTEEGPHASAMPASTGPAPVPVAWTAAAAGLVAFVAWAFFSKLSRPDVLAHPRRQRILELVRREPGVGMNALAQTLNLRWPKAAYHVGRLERDGHVVSHRVGGRIVLFPNGAGFRGRERAIALLRSPSHVRLHGLLTSRPGLDQMELARLLGLHRTQVSRLLSALTGTGLARVERGPHRSLYYASPPS